MEKGELKGIQLITDGLPEKIAKWRTAKKELKQKQALEEQAARKRQFLESQARKIEQREEYFAESFIRFCEDLNAPLKEVKDMSDDSLKKLEEYITYKIALPRVLAPLGHLTASLAGTYGLWKLTGWAVHWSLAFDKSGNTLGFLASTLLIIASMLAAFGLIAYGFRAISKVINWNDRDNQHNFRHFKYLWFCRRYLKKVKGKDYLPLPVIRSYLGYAK